MTSKDKHEAAKSGVRTIDLLNSFDDDESFQIEILPSNKKSNNPATIDLVTNGRPMSSNSIKVLGEFMSKVENRIKSKNNSSPINTNFQLTPSLHTRSKIQVKKTNEYISKTNIHQQQRLILNKKYQTPKTFNSRLSQQSRVNAPLRQTKLNVVSIDDMKNYGFNTLTMPKPGESIYPPKKKPQPEKPIFKGIEFSLINSSKYNMTEKEREQKRRHKEQKLKKEKQAEEKAKEERKLFYESMLFGGLQNAQNKTNQQKQHEQSEDEQLKNLDMLEQIQNDQKLYEGASFETDEDRLTIQKRGRYSLNEVIKPYDSSHAFPFVKAILGYDFGKDNQPSNSRRIPNVFHDPQVYKKTFHYLVINESIADIQQRMKKLQKDTSERLEIQIVSTSQNSNGLSELKIKETDTNNNFSDQQAEDGKQKNGKFLLKNYSMSKNRIGVITTQENFKLSKYGIKSFGKNNKQLSFTFLCLLKTPESKQELKDDVRVQSCVSQSELEFILKMKKSRKAYFYDIEKLSTNIRQYMSISNIEYSYLAPHIYNPNFIQTQKRNLVHVETRDCINDVLEVLEKDFNSTQFQSIRQMVLRESGIVLLQGPPGTGKTSTLLGLLSAQYSYLKRIGDSRKIMICAPSNAAIDHIAKRICSEGLVNGQGLKIHPNVLRLGIVDTQDPDITSCSLDHICQSKIVAEKNKSLRESKMTSIQIRENLVVLQKQIKSLNQQLIRAQRERNLNLVQKFQDDIKEKNREYLRMEGLLYSFRRQKIISRKLYQEMEKQLIKQAQILIVTLSSSGGEKIEQVRNDIACLIVDEAAQATEPSLLIAFQTGVDKVMLVGDPYQLPATTISSDSNKTLFNRSLFERFIDSGIEPYFLNIQYRMSPMIRKFPSERFYQQRLVDGDNIFKREIPQSLKPLSFQRSVIFIDLKCGQQRIQQSSFCNSREASLIGKILKRYKLLESRISVGIITPYQAQRKLLLKEIELQQSQFQKTNQSIVPQQQQSDNNKRNSIMINTIDSFQGQQKDLVLISTVRANDKKQIGFLMDERRINVSITRAKHAMIIIGNGDTLSTNEVWDGYLKAIQLNKLYFQINSIEDEERIVQNLYNKTYFNFQPSTRKTYPREELTFDPRRIKMKEMNEDVFRKKGKGRRQQQKQEVKYGRDDNKMMLERLQPDQGVQRYQHERSLNDYSSAQLSRQRTADSYFHSSTSVGRQITSQTLSRFGISNSFHPMKKSHIPYSQDMQYQAQQLIRKKRKQEQETKQFQKYCQRLKQVQKQKANDDFYKFLFQ